MVVPEDVIDGVVPLVFFLEKFENCWFCVVESHGVGVVCLDFSIVDMEGCLVGVMVVLGDVGEASGLGSEFVAYVVEFGVPWYVFSRLVRFYVVDDDVVVFFLFDDDDPRRIPEFKVS